MPQRICAASKAGPAGAAVASTRSLVPSAISLLVPTSMNSRTPLVAREAGGEHAGDDVAADVGAERREDDRGRARVDADAEVGRQRGREVVRGDDERRHRQRLGVDAERELGHRHVADDDDLVDLGRRRRPPPRSTSPASWASVSCARASSAPSACVVEHRGRHARDDVGAVGLLAVEHRAHRGRLAGLEVEQRGDDRRGAEVERDREPARGRVAGLDAISRSSQTTAVTSKCASRSILPSVFTTASSTRGSRSSSASSTRCTSERWSSSVGSSSTRWRFCTAGRRITWRPTPTSAAFGRVCSGGTSTTRSSRAGARQASRQPSRSSSGLNARGSTELDRHVAVEHPHLALLARAVAAARGVDRDAVPARGVEDRRAAGHAHVRRRRARSAGGRAAEPSTAGAVTTSRPPPGARGGRRSSSTPRRRGRAAGRPPGRSFTHTSAVLMIALVRPAAIAIGRKAALSTCRSGRPNETFDAPRHMFTPSSSRISRIVSSVVVTASVSAPTVIASGSITTSSGGMPWSPATDTILRRDLEPLLRRLGDAGLVVGEADHRGAVARDQRQDLLEPVVLAGHASSRAPCPRRRRARPRAPRSPTSRCRSGCRPCPAPS